VLARWAGRASLGMGPRSCVVCAPGRKRRRRSERTPAVNENAPETDESEWFSEGNVQAVVVSHLAATGWRFRRGAHTATSEHGFDIDADRPRERLLIGGQGYPVSLAGTCNDP
jgi:hypothetical protein